VQRAQWSDFSYKYLRRKTGIFWAISPEKRLFYAAGISHLSVQTHDFTA
jgi:hypothetical protein